MAQRAVLTSVRDGTSLRRQVIRRIPAKRAVLAIVVSALALSLPGAAVAAAQCGVKTNPPLGGSYDAFNLPTPPGTYNTYYSYWSSPQPYWARRRQADGMITYEKLRPSGGTWEFANCTNSICTNAQRRTQLQNSNGASGWGWWIEAWNTTSTSDC
jgi:hypothetical protein